MLIAVGGILGLAYALVLFYVLARYPFWVAMAFTWRRLQPAPTLRDICIADHKTQFTDARQRRDHLPDVVDELPVLQVEYEKCGRSGQYRLDQLIMCQGR